MKYIFLLILATLIASCNVQKTYYDASLSVAIDEEDAGNLRQAEDNYLSAVWRAKNHLGDKEVSTALYDMGAFYRRHGKYEASISALKESIEFANKSEAFNNLAMGRRYVTISASHAELAQWVEGTEYVRLIVPFWSQYSENELEFVKAVFTVYHQQLSEMGRDVTFLPSEFLPEKQLYQ